MYLDYLYLIPNEILYYYIWPNISNNIKMLLNKQLFNKYYQQYYNKYCNNKYNNKYNNNAKYLTYIIKNDIAISLHYLLINNIIQLTNKKIWYYNNLIFFDTYSFFIYLSKKYKSHSCKKILNTILRQIDIKEYKKYTDKNTKWIK